jgi:hypothetical protein
MTSREVIDALAQFARIHRSHNPNLRAQIALLQTASRLSNTVERRAQFEVVFPFGKRVDDELTRCEPRSNVRPVDSLHDLQRLFGKPFDFCEKLRGRLRCFGTRAALDENAPAAFFGRRRRRGEKAGGSQRDPAQRIAKFGVAFENVFADLTKTSAFAHAR